MNSVFQALRTQVRAIQQTSLLGSHCRLFVELRRTPGSMYDRMTYGLRNMNGLIDEWAQEEAAVLLEEGQRVWCGLLARMVMMVAVIWSLMHSQRTPRDHMVDFRNCAGVVLQAAAYIDRFWLQYGVLVRVTASCRSIDFNTSMWLDESQPPTEEMLSLCFPLIAELISVCMAVFDTIGYFGHGYH